jgi:hypothetical protein
MSSFRDYYKSLCGDVPKLSEPKAKIIINDALQQIFDSYLWHFLIAQDYIIVPNQVILGTVAVTRGLATVTPNATSKAILDSFGLLPPLTDCQLRITGRGSLGGQPYEIVGYDSSLPTDNLTLSRSYLGATNPTASYSIYRAYFSPPLSSDLAGNPFLDFVRFKVIHNREIGFRPMQLTSQKWINDTDPLRSSPGDPYRYAPFRTRDRIFDTSSGTYLRDDTPLFEFWPYPVAQRNFFCVWQRRGSQLVADEDTIPSPLTQNLLMTLARYLAYEWADSNKGQHKELTNVNWSRKRSEIMDPRSRGSFNILLGQAIKLDREIFLASDIGNYYYDIYGRGFPGGDWYKSHAISGGYSVL